MSKPLPPQRALQFLRWFCREDYLEEIEGNLIELYEKQYDVSPAKAKWQFCWNVLWHFRPAFIRSVKVNYPQNYSAMLRHNFIVSFRNLQRNKAYALINVVGLTLGIACAILIFILVKYHLSFDTFHTKADRIYRITSEFHQDEVSYSSAVPSPVGKAFRDDYALAEKVGRVASFPDQLITVPSSNGTRKFQEETGVAFAEPAFFDILDFPLIYGDKHTVLREPNAAIITERMARKYFGKEDPIGKILILDHRLDFRIVGILRDLPANTDRRQEIYLSYSNLKDFHPWLGNEESWSDVYGNMHCFVLLKPHVSPAIVEQAFSAMSKKYYNERDAKVFRFKLQPLSDIHFNADLDGYLEKKTLWALSLIGLFLLMTACVNFINLATAQAMGRSKEIGVRKVLGSVRWQLFWQFMAETTVISTLAMVLAIALAYFVLPYVNQLFDIKLRINLYRDAHLLTFLPLLLFIVIFISGSYPGLVLAGLQPVLALKGKLTQKHVGGFTTRRVLVVVQFAISQLLIIGTIVIANQMQYAQQSDVGFEKEAIIMLPVPIQEESLMRMLDAQLAQITGVEKVAFCSEAPAGPRNDGTFIRYDGRAEYEEFPIAYKAGDDQYVSTFDLEIVAGRNLQPSDTIRELLINETTVKKLGALSNQEVIGKSVHIYGIDATIVGVIKDFHNMPFHTAIEALCITTSMMNYSNCAVKVNPINFNHTLTALEKVWNEAYPDYVYEYEFLDERIARFYKREHMMLRLIQSFALIAIFIGCLGLYGLISFMAAHKTKEVGVRKVLGASVEHILWLFGKEFTCLLLIAFAIAAPLAWWVMQNWLENFTYRVEIGVGVFVLAMLMTMIVAVLAVGYKSVKAALMNPTQSLRSE